MVRGPAEDKDILTTHGAEPGLEAHALLGTAFRAVAYTCVAPEVNMARIVRATEASGPRSEA